MSGINDQELDCLRKIAHNPADLTPPCASPILEHLLALGFIEQSPGICLPLEMTRVTYHITVAGQTILKRG